MSSRYYIVKLQIMEIIERSKKITANQMADLFKKRHGADALIQYQQVLVFLESNSMTNDYFYKVYSILSK